MTPYEMDRLHLRLMMLAQVLERIIAAPAIQSDVPGEVHEMLAVLKNGLNEGPPPRLTRTLFRSTTTDTPPPADPAR